MKISPLRWQEATWIKILQGLVVDDGVEHIVTIGYDPGGSTLRHGSALAGSPPNLGAEAAPAANRPLGPRTGTNGHKVIDTIIDD
ncbi:hypothetical protein THAOC_35156 [Thalassiosira oceanica]|uniref:Uncharacterized protein n=1 Tax=Thalassiosira oceanica TaxID=159749 RepID=K0R2C0_THAOC|nr:hypothetical protein THAOC_35156 [Thalassiosira oceanica]|eukprot:EJK46190.1 hypothetical protein THAOC_35156 [Thalassiosira oceanica]